MDPRIAEFKQEYDRWWLRTPAAEVNRRWAYVRSLPWATGRETTLECYVAMNFELKSGLAQYMCAVMTGVPGDASILTAEEERVLSEAVVQVGAAGRPYTWSARDKQRLKSLLDAPIGRP